MNPEEDRLTINSDKKSSVSRIYRFEQTGCREVDDVVTVEEPLEIRLAYPGKGRKTSLKSLAVTMRTPGADFDLVRGFLFTEGIIQRPEDVLSMRFGGCGKAKGSREQVVIVNLADQAAVEAEKVQPRLYMSSSCGLCGKSSLDMLQKEPSYPVIPERPAVNKEVLGCLPEILRHSQAAFQQTGGIHACGLFDITGNLLLVSEDVGRHNALDKLIGIALQQGMLPFRDQIILFSGRLGFELVQKAMMAGAPFLCAIGAPSSLALRLANKCGMTIVGFLHKNRFNVYGGRERIQ